MAKNTKTKNDENEPGTYPEMLLWVILLLKIQEIFQNKYYIYLILLKCCFKSGI